MHFGEIYFSCAQTHIRNHGESLARFLLTFFFEQSLPQIYDHAFGFFIVAAHHDDRSQRCRRVAVEFFRKTQARHVFHQRHDVMIVAYANQQTVGDFEVVGQFL